MDSKQNQRVISGYGAGEGHFSELEIFANLKGFFTKFDLRKSEQKRYKMKRRGEILIVLNGPGASEKVRRDFGAVFGIKT